MKHYAHTRKGAPKGEWEPLEDHLAMVATLAGEFASAFGADSWGYLAGLWHDLGKYSHAFQKYLAATATIADDGHRPELAGRVDHSTAGAQHAARLGPLGRLLAYCIAGHHAGLPDNEAGAAGLSMRLRKHDAFRYTTALNHLLANASRKVRIGDATVVFWTDRVEAKDAEEVFAAFFGEEALKNDAAESGKMVDRLHAFLVAARQGRLVDQVRDPEAPFYVLGLSPNASRINVRFWLAGTVTQFAKRLVGHADDLEIAGADPGAPPLVVRRLLDETVPPKKGWPDREKISPSLGGDLTRAILLGLPYPQTLLPAVVRRVRAEGFVTRDSKRPGSYRADWRTAAHRRAAIIKAFLVRNKHWEVPAALNKDHTDEAYHLGRLFAALEKTQEDAAGSGVERRELNTTIKDRYFGAASATPASIFPLLLRLHQHHMNKIENVGLRVNREKLIGEICGHVSRFPPHLPLEKQGLFHVAYYHQRQDFFTKKDDSVKETAHA